MISLFSKLSNIIEINKKKILISFISIYTLVGLFMVLTKNIEGFIILTSVSILLFIFIVYVKINYHITYEKDPVRNLYWERENPVHGDAHEATKQEVSINWNLSDSIQEIPNFEDIIGYDNEHKYYSIKGSTDKNSYLPNKNELYLGIAGTGKSNLILQKLYQTLLRGWSIVITDTKGDMYSLTVKIARLMGYEIKVLNLKPNEISFSDAVDFLKVLRNTDYDSASIKATELATTIMQNTNDGIKGDQFFYPNEENFLKALFLRIGLRDENNTFSDCKLYLESHRNLDDILADFEMLPKNHPAYRAFIPFKRYIEKNPKTVSDFIEGAEIRLKEVEGVLINVLGHDEISLTKPMKKKCIYYIVTKEKCSQYNFILATFINTMLNELVDYYDYQKSIGKEDRIIPVSFIFDEFANCGIIPDFHKTITTVRSRQIALNIAIQSCSQMEDLYGKENWATISDNIATKIYLGTSDANKGSNADIFSEWCGSGTAVELKENYEENRGLIPIKSKATRNRSINLIKRPLYLPAELTSGFLKKHEIIIKLFGASPIRLTTSDANKHPLAIEYSNIQNASTRKHIPKWKKDKNNETKEENIKLFELEECEI